jgi:lipid-A-disaccharide synthase
VGLSCSYVGHPVVESGADRGDGPRFRARHAVPAAAPLLTVLPGSRRGEVQRMLPVFGAAVARLAASHSDLRVVVPTVDTVAEMVVRGVGSWPVPTVVVRGEAEKYDAFAASDAALAASGTVALELAMARLPAVVAYRVNALTHGVVRRIVRVRYIHLVNLILGRMAVPELIQQDCTAERLAAAAARLIVDRAAGDQQVAACQEALRALGLGTLSPARRAAEEVLAVIARRGAARRRAAQ